MPAHFDRRLNSTWIVEEFVLRLLSYDQKLTLFLCDRSCKIKPRKARNFLSKVRTGSENENPSKGKKIRSYCEDSS
jgi:hypothetical protein